MAAKQILWTSAGVFELSHHDENPPKAAGKRRARTQLNIDDVRGVFDKPQAG